MRQSTLTGAISVPCRSATTQVYSCVACSRESTPPLLDILKPLIAELEREGIRTRETFGYPPDGRSVKTIDFLSKSYELTEVTP